MVKILHCADIHFCSSFSSIPSKLAEIRKDELRRTFGEIIETVKRENVDILLISGDLFDSKNVTPDIIDFLCRKFAEIGHVKIFISAGNHDPLENRSYYRAVNFGENVHIFGTSIESVEIPSLRACVYGVSFSDRFCQNPLLEGFTAKSGDTVNIMVLHGDLAPSSMYNPVSLEQIATSGLDYLALGHVHNYDGIKRAGKTYYAYCGAPEGRGFDECGPKGVIVGEVGKNFCSLEFLPVSKRSYEVLQVDVTGCSNIDDVIEGAGSLSENNLYKIVLTGKTSLSLNTDILRRIFSEKAFYVKVSDETHASYESEGDFGLKAEFIREIEKSGEDEEIAELAKKIGLLALDGKEVHFDED